MDLEAFIAKWSGLPGGAERANFQPFIGEFCRALGLPEPEPATGGLLSDYRFEAPVRPDAAFSAKQGGAIDLYKRHCFVLEAKQSRLKDGERAPDSAAAPAVQRVVERDLFGNETVRETAAPRPKARRYDKLMEDALAQAKGYALALPADHGWPPFIIICDVGRAFEIYFDWAGNGKGYGFFPDQANYRIELADLRKSDIRKRLIGLWTDPASIDPRRQTVKVTREIAGRLAKVSKYLEENFKFETQIKALPDWQKSQGIEETSMFLMRMLFCMFAEDVGLLPEKSFQSFIEDSIGKSDNYWQSGLDALWSRMNNPDANNRYWSHGDAVVRYFNGNLFTHARVIPLPKQEKGELLAAARAEWKEVEPAIFGTLLEQALTDTERAKLGAHYTPRPYVERLVEATIMEELRSAWEALRQADAGPDLAAVQDFHARLAEIRVLDPACGTGNFLYVAMEQLLRLETDVLVLIAQLGGEAAPRISPNQFLGLELNPRAAVIAELVLWIGWLRFRLANDPGSIGEPVLPPLSNINFGGHGGYDALLAANPQTGERADLANPRPAEWPAADYIVGNPPFIGGKDVRARLGGDYAEALWSAWPDVPKSADFVMHWWDRAAAELLQPNTRLRRFGFVTTNSITQSFSRRVIEQRLADDDKPGLSLLLAIPDHPWTRATTDAAAVRIAMTVAAAGSHDGELIEIVGESGLDSDTPALVERRQIGRINADLSTGTDVTSVSRLAGNDGLCSPGVKLHGDGFIVTPAQAEQLGLGRRLGLEAHIRAYRNGRDLLQRSRDVMVIDLFGLTEAEVRQRFPEVYSHLLTTVKPAREAVAAKSRTSDAQSYAQKWWLFGKSRPELRPALAGLRRSIVTVETAKHRIFQFLPADILADNRIVVIGSDDAFHLGVLQWCGHSEWSLVQGGTLEDRPVYTKSGCFDPFPFPDASADQRAAIAAIAEELDLTRRVALDENAGLTMTGLYNLVAPIRSNAALTAEQEAAATRARARIVAKLHDDLDAAVSAAYGWPHPLPPAEIVARLVALNRERAAEEAAGHIRWLRPDYQAKQPNPGSSPG
jgi:hypothetical protein